MLNSSLIFELWYNYAGTVIDYVYYFSKRDLFRQFGMQEVTYNNNIRNEYDVLNIHQMQVQL